MRTTRKCHNHISQTNLWHHEEETAERRQRYTHNWKNTTKLNNHLSLLQSGDTRILIPKYEQRHEISNNVVCATSKDSDQPAHTTWTLCGEEEVV